MMNAGFTELAAWPAGDLLVAAAIVDVGLSRFRTG
jgi:hypothetical protein